MYPGKNIELPYQRISSTGKFNFLFHCLVKFQCTIMQNKKKKNA